MTSADPTLTLAPRAGRIVSSVGPTARGRRAMRIRGWITAFVLAAVTASGEEPGDALARGKLESDLGHAAAAAEAFAAVARSDEATPQQRAEALVRLGVARRDLGDAVGSAAAFEEAYRRHGKDKQALAFLVLALGRALPSDERWDETWSKVAVDVDRRVPERPEVRVFWPGGPVGLCPCSGTLVSLDLMDGELQDLFRLFADVSGLNVVVQPGVHGRVTYRANGVPWDETLERMLAPNGYVARLEGRVLWIGPPGALGERHVFRGAPLNLDYHDKDLIEALSEVAANGGASVEVAEGVAGHVTFKLADVPWDQAFDLLARVNGLAWKLEGDVIHVGLPKRAQVR